MWPPKLFDEQPKQVQFVLAFVLPAVFGGICGYFLGHSEVVYTVLTTLGILGGINAGYEHIGAGEGVRRGFVGGGLFALFILIVHAIDGNSPPFDLPGPLGVMCVIYFVLGMAFGALGGWLRWRTEGKPARAD